ncbi:flagellar filament capping protein FliD [Viridibacillus arvi]|uniref:flagellar filament capping protein FliD n=1 Tax=Viridibacillus arvi TaxID=263475 RepID=UPI003D06FBC9
MVNRVGGLASGMNIDALVEKLMTAERVPLDKLNQKKTTYEWQRDAYRGINTKMKTFSDYLFDNFLLSSNFVKNKVNVSNSKAISVSAGSGASGTLNIQGIGKLATAATSKVTTTATLSKNALSSDDKLSDFGVATSGELKIKVNGEEKTLVLNEGTTLSDLQTTLGSGVLKVSGGKLTFGNSNVVVDDANTKNQLKNLGVSFSDTFDVGGSKKIDIANTADLASLGINGTLTFKVGDTTKSLTVGPDNSDPDTITTVQDLMNKLGSDFKLSLKDGKFSFGKSEISVTDDNTKEALEKLGFDVGNKVASTELKYATGGSKGTLTDKSLLGELGITNGKLELEVIGSNGKMTSSTVSYNESDTIESFMKKLNGAGLTALVTEDGKMSITANSTGQGIDGAAIRIKSEKTDEEIPTEKDANEGVLKKLGFSTGNDGKTIADGTDSEYMVNGLKMTSKSNTVTISGYSVTLNETYNATVDGTGNILYGSESAISVSADKDIDSMVDKIKEFVSKYNELISGINDQLKETKYRAYAPLTAEQRKDMTESEQKLWDEKAMSGLLRGDSILRSGLGDMRNAIYSQVNGLGDKVIDTMFEMGITTSSTISDGGKLVINETKLRKALEEDPDRVVKTLTQTGSKTDADGDTRGIVKRLRDSMEDFTKNIEKKAGRATMTDSQYTIGKSLISFEDRITALTARLKDVEARYWKQFSAMEAAINKANSQSSIFAQFGGQ